MSRPLKKVILDLIRAYEDLFAQLDAQGPDYCYAESALLEAILGELHNDHDIDIGFDD